MVFVGMSANCCGGQVVEVMKQIKEAIGLPFVKCV